MQTRQCAIEHSRGGLYNPLRHRRVLGMSEVSKIYDQFADSLRMAQRDHSEDLKAHAKLLDEVYSSILKPRIWSFAEEFGDQVRRLELRTMVESFLGSSEVPFVAIDGSCARDLHSEYVVFYGGAYGSRGTVTLSAAGGTLVYRRWEFSKDISMVAFLPIPPEGGGALIDEQEASDYPQVASDQEVAEVSSVHTKIMQLAEVYLAYSLAGSSTVEAPKLILLDGSLSGMLGNTSFSPDVLQLVQGDFDGVQIGRDDAYAALAHPFSSELHVPSWKNFQPQNRLIAEATWGATRTIELGRYSDAQQEVLRKGAAFLHKRDMGTLAGDRFTFRSDPRASWRRCLEVAEGVCDGLFREKRVTGITYKVAGTEGRKEYFSSRDIQFLTGVILRALIERCWSQRILLVGIAKDSNSRYFIRNYVGSVQLLEQGEPGRGWRIRLTDRSVLELLPNLVADLRAPWGTTEFDSSFMTLRPRQDENGAWAISGTPNPRLGETTRPERIFVRSIVQFLLRDDRSLASHAVFLDRLCYPGWDDTDDSKITLKTKQFGPVYPLFFGASPPRLQRLSMYLLSVLVRNHFPEALGYPDPLHKADWGAKSMRRRVDTLLQSGAWAERSNPRSRTFRQIREDFGR